MGNALDILSNKRPEMDQLAEVLLVKETLDANEFLEIANIEQKGKDIRIDTEDIIIK